MSASANQFDSIMLLANVALPSFLGHWIAFAIVSPLVVAIEAIVLRHVLKTPFGESLDMAIHANWRSTLVGFPIGWLLAAAGLIPAGLLSTLLPSQYRDPAFQIVAFTALTGGIVHSRFSMIAMATGHLLILVPYYFATLRVERRVIEQWHPELDRELVSRAVCLMNRLTYSVLALLVLWWLAVAIVDYQ